MKGVGKPYEHFITTAMEESGLTEKQIKVSSYTCSITESVLTVSIKKLCLFSSCMYVLSRTLCNLLLWMAFKYCNSSKQLHVSISGLLILGLPVQILFPVQVD
jgi:hypothetical protein